MGRVCRQFERDQGEQSNRVADKAAAGCDFAGLESHALSLSERSRFVHRVLESLEPAPADQLDAVWLTEIDSRAEAVQKGIVTPIPWEAVREGVILISGWGGWETRRISISRLAH
jgi:putative addiction module component (TIGR02574 family)